MVFAVAVAILIACLLTFLSAIGVTAVLAFKKRLRWPWLWIVGALAYPPTAHIAVQANRIEAPKPRAWIARLMIGPLVAWAIVQFGSGPWANSIEMRSFIAELSTIFSSRVLVPNGPRLLLDGGQEIELAEFSQHSFATCATTVLVGLAFFRRPILHAALLGIATFTIAVLIHAWWLAGLADVISDPTRASEVDVWASTMGVFVICLPQFLAYWASFGLACIESRQPRRVVEEASV